MHKVVQKYAYTAKNLCMFVCVCLTVACVYVLQSVCETCLHRFTMQLQNVVQKSNLKSKSL